MIGGCCIASCELARFLLMKELTRRQREVLDFIEDYLESRGYPPSVRDIAARFNLVSAAGVHKHIKALVKKNYLSKADFLSRSINIVAKQGRWKKHDTVLKYDRNVTTRALRGVY